MSDDNNPVIVRTIIKKEFEVMQPNTFIHPDEKKVLRAFAAKLKDFVEPDDADTVENKEFKAALQILDRISL